MFPRTSGKEFVSLAYVRTYATYAICRTPSPTLKFSDVFRVYRKGALGTNGLKKKKTSTFKKKEASNLKWYINKRSQLEVAYMFN